MDKDATGTAAACATHRPLNRASDVRELLFLRFTESLASAESAASAPYPLKAGLPIQRFNIA